MVAVALDIFGQELASDGPRRHHVVVAVVATPFSEVIRDVESSWGGGRVFVVDEVDRGGFLIFGGDSVPVLLLLRGKDNDVRTEEIAVGEDQLVGKSN